MALFLLPATWNGYYSYFVPRAIPIRSDWISDIGRIVTYAGLIATVLFIAWGSGDGLRRFGISAVPWWKWMSVSLAALVFSLCSHREVSAMFYGPLPDSYNQSSELVRSNVAHVKAGWPNTAMHSMMFAVAAFAEELIMRGYLISRLSELFGRTWAAVLVSTAVFASYHIYEGTMAVVIIFLDGLAYSACLLVTKSLWPGATAHALSNALQLFVRVNY